MHILGSPAVYTLALTGMTGERLFTKDVLTSCDIQCRYTLFLSTFVYDTLWSLHLGRPRTISLSSLRVAQDSIQNCEENRLFQTGNFMVQLLDLDAHIQNIYEALPPDLTYQKDSVTELDAAGYSYHMQYHGIEIILHQALMKSSLVVETPLRESTTSMFDTSRYTPDSSSTIMYESATCITELTVMYKQVFGLDKMVTFMLNNIYMAGITLINHALVLQHHGAPIESDMIQIRHLADTLDQVQTNFPIASSMCKTMLEVLRGTSLGSLVYCVSFS